MTLEDERQTWDPNPDSNGMPKPLKLKYGEGSSLAELWVLLARERGVVASIGPIDEACD
jgi:hypothetical protein